jgi:glucose-1-phosphate cytidylyltransferase
MKVVLLAGGFGTRISEESHLKPKPMIEIGDRPILWHIMKSYSTQGFDDFIICLGYKGNVIKEYFAHYFLQHSDVTFDFRDGNRRVVHSHTAEPWRVTLVDTGLETMTGGRLKRIASYVGDEPFMMTYGDGVADIDIAALLAFHKARGRKATLTAAQPGGRFGVLHLGDDGASVRGFREKAREDGGWVNAGFFVLEPSVFDYIEGDATYFEREPLETLAAEGQLSAYRHTGFWQPMDTQRDKMVLEEALRSGNAPWKRW